MKRIAFALLLALGATSLFAQPGPRGGGPGGQRISPEQRVERLTKALELTETQQTELLDFYKTSAAAIRDEMEAVETREERRAIMDEYRGLAEEKMKTLLTEEQLEKLEKMKARKEERADNRRDGDRPARRRRGGKPDGGK